MNSNPFAQDMQDVAQKICVDPALLTAICEVESSYNPWVMRYEPAWSYLYFPRETADRLGITAETETVMQMCSFGLCQVMGSVFREMGFDGHLSQVMASPRISLQYGAMKIRSLMQRYGEDEPSIISAYNAGSAKKTPGGMFINERYVDAVTTVLNRIRGSV